MATIKVYYAKLNNMGDLLSEYLIPMITGKQVTHCENVSKFQIMGVGSCGGAVWGKKEPGAKEALKDSIKFLACKTSNEPCAIWGTGFFKEYYPNKLQLLRKNTSFISVRGALSKRIIENSIGTEINPVLCDGGILAAELLPHFPEKKYDVGFIPHYNEQKLFKDKGLESAFSEKYKDSVVINLREDPLSVIEEIGRCRYIISSSLHGCVVADSFEIPNIRVSLSDIPGTGFKFDDYYSGFDLSIPSYNINKISDIPSIETIIQNYIITPKMVSQKKKEMYDCLNDFSKSI